MVARRLGRSRASTVRVDIVSGSLASLSDEASSSEVSLESPLEVSAAETTGEVVNTGRRVDLLLESSATTEAGSLGYEYWTEMPCSESV